jgi:hypothetical protein
MLFFWMLCLSLARADDFQIKERTGADVFNLPYLTVKIPNAPFAGITDAYGRLSVNLRPGSYTAEVYSGQQLIGRVTLTIDDNRSLKTVLLEATTP